MVMSNRRIAGLTINHDTIGIGNAHEPGRYQVVAGQENGKYYRLCR